MSYRVGTRRSGSVSNYSDQFDTKCANLNHKNWLNGKRDTFKLVSLKNKKVSANILHILIEKKLITKKSGYLCENCISVTKEEYFESDKDDEDVFEIISNTSKISLNVEQPDANEKFKTCSTQTEVINDAEIVKNICLKIKSNSLSKHLILQLDDEISIFLN
jgi:hypothetical protein